MAQETPVISGASAIVNVQTPDGVIPIGIMESVDVSERYNLEEIIPLGQLYTAEIAVTRFNGSGSFTLFHYDPAKSFEIQKLDFRIASTLEEWKNYLLNRIRTDGLVLDFQQQQKVGVLPNGLPDVRPTSFAMVKYVFINDVSFSLNTGQVSRRRYSFLFTDPIIYPPKQ